MKNKINITQMSIFLVLLLFSSLCRKKSKQFPFTPSLKSIKNTMDLLTNDHNNFEIMINSYKIPDECQSTNQQQCELKITKYKEFKSNMVKAKELISKFRIFYDELISEMHKMFNYTYNLKKKFDERNRERHKIGYNWINKLINVFMDPKQVKQTLKFIYNVLKKNYEEKQKSTTHTSFLERRTKKIKKQFLRRRIWSSFRLEEVFDTIKMTGENVAKTCISQFLSSMQPTYCLKPQYTMGHPTGKCPDNHSKFDGICLENCKKDYLFSAGLCTKKCGKGEIDCGPFCALKSCNIESDLIAKDSYIPNFKTSREKEITCQDKFYKHSLLCIRDCNYYGLENCDIGTCASTKGFCNSKLPQTSNDFDQYFVNYLGYIFSMKSNSTFQYSDPNSFESTVDELVKYSTVHTDRIRQTSKNMQRLLNDPDINHWYRRSIKWGIINKFTIYSDKEKNKLVDICRSVAIEWLKMADEKSRPFDFNTLRSPFEMIDWKVCEDYDNRSKEKCTTNIVNFIKRIGANDLPGITAEFLYPTCRLYL
jgi:hypothetical protein